MADDAQSRATEKYRRKNVHSFNVKFFPADSDIYEWFQDRENKNKYLKDLIRADMEGRITMNPREYTFVSANMGDIEFSVAGDYVDGSKDMEVHIVETGEIREFDDIDGSSVDEMFEWLMDRGVEFESDASLWFNVHYVASVMLDGDATRESLLAKVADMTSDELGEWRSSMFDA